jgi:hypothetical protein
LKEKNALVRKALLQTQKAVKRDGANADSLNEDLSAFKK